VAELRRGIEGRVDRWSVRHGVEVEKAWRSAAVHAGRRQCSAGSGRKKDVTTPPGWAGWTAWVTQVGWAISQGRILLNLNRIFRNWPKL
jgi:hypothetical protein